MFAQVYVVTLTLVFSRFRFVSATSSCIRSYTVQDGDICDTISQKNHVSTHQLSGANPNISCDKLEVGDHICLALDEDCTDTQTVEEGDTCQKIADENGVDLPTLLKNNPQIGEPENWTIYPGEVLCVAKKVIVHSSGTPSPPSTTTGTTTGTPPPITTSTPPPSTTPSPSVSANTSGETITWSNSSGSTVSNPDAVAAGNNMIMLPTLSPSTSSNSSPPGDTVTTSPPLSISSPPSPVTVITLPTFST